MGRAKWETGRSLPTSWNFVFAGKNLNLIKVLDSSCHPVNWEI